jgi:sugar lactone lactonase YvrE
MRRHLASVLLALGLIASTGTPAAASAFPGEIRLPDGFQPEGIATGPGPFAYFGSRADGSIYRANLATGEGGVISQGPGTPSLGMKIDRRGRLFVAGGTGGDARVVDARSGRILTSYPLHAAPSFVNDVTLTGRAAWFTDSTNPVLYKLAFGPHGALPATVTRIPLTGDLVYTTGTNANGIVTTPDGRGLIVVQSNTGGLFRVDPATGATTAVDLAGDALPNGDGLLLQGRTLFAVQNQMNTVAAIRLNRAGTAGTVVTRVTDPRLDVPTTVAAFGRRLYLPNARFNTTPEPTTTYSAIAIPRP